MVWLSISTLPSCDLAARASFQRPKSLLSVSVSVAWERFWSTCGKGRARTAALSTLPCVLIGSLSTAMKVVGIMWTGRGSMKRRERRKAFCSLSAW